MRLLQEVVSPHQACPPDQPLPALLHTDPRNSVRTYVYDPQADYAPLACVEQAQAAQGVPAPEAKLYYYHTDPVGLPMEVTDAAGNTVWAGHYGAWGKLERQDGAFRQPLRYPGQYADDEIGLHYNTFRYYDPVVGRFITQDPIGLAGGLNLYAYAPNPNGWSDPWGWVEIALGAGGYTTYGLYHEGQTTPYYVGHTKQSLPDRFYGHVQRGRANAQVDWIDALVKDVKYSEAKGYEQAFSEKYGTKTGFPGNVNEPINKMRKGKRGASHLKNYKKAAKELGIKATQNQSCK
jgi:RHS repeat-associated protein